MNALFRLLGVMTSFVVIVSLITPAEAQTNFNLSEFVQASQKRRSRPSRGFPGNRTERASRGCAPSESNSKSLVAIAPEWTDAVSSRKNVWGQTAASHPTLWFFVPFTTATQLEFSLQTQDENDVYRTVVPVPSQPGIIAVEVPKTAPALKLDQPYRWTLKAVVPCPSAEPDQPFVQGWIERVTAPEIAAGDSSMKARQYAEVGIWYDAVTTVAESRLRSPNDAKLKYTWVELLRSEQLEIIADQPMRN